MIPWIGFDLDGTLAQWIEGSSINEIGEPIPLMIAKAMEYLNKGTKIKIVTARVNEPNDPVFVKVQTELINEWCIKNLGRVIEITSSKDFYMFYMYDDRCKQVITNTGQLLEDFIQ